ncbi:peptidoglycan-associated lipoprotein Pal [Aquabacterium fontiphilum]|nr:peptidoglycan-associated lipoprotein Pal [Aquabacterium fontiphilum]
MTRSQSVLSSRSLALGVLAAAALALAGCGSRVKLDDKASGAAPITSAAPGEGAGAGGVASSNVAPVVVAPDANDAAASNIARIVYFDFDSFLVKDEFRPVVEAHARRMNAARDTRIVIEGHTDERGGREYNLALGQRRAEAVQRSLTLLGVSAERIEAVSFGEERPAATGSDESAWSQNRRAEIKDR